MPVGHITISPKNEPRTHSFGKLAIGDGFLHSGRLWVKVTRETAHKFQCVDEPETFSPDIEVQGACFDITVGEYLT